jgi:competence protein ComEA
MSGPPTFNDDARDSSSVQCTSTKEDIMTRGLVTLTVLAALAAAPAITAVTTRTVTAAAIEKVNINTASVKELQKLDGVGRGVAQRIVDYREANGPFKRGEDLRKVEGIGAATFERNRERIVVK